MKAVLIALFLSAVCYGGVKLSKPDPCDPCKPADPCATADPCDPCAVKTIKVGGDKTNYQIQYKDQLIVKMRQQIKEQQAQIAALQTENALLLRKLGSKDSGKMPGMNTTAASGQSMSTTQTLGVYLGETLEALKERVAVQPGQLVSNEYGIADISVFKYRTNSPEFPEGFVHVYKGQIFRIDAQLKSKNQKDLETQSHNVVANLNVKYGDTSGNSTTSPTDTEFSREANIGGIKVTVQFRKGWIRYKHDEVIKQILEDNQGIKAGQVKSGL